MPLLFLQHQHEVVVEATLHHHPVHRARQVNVRRQKHNVLASECGNCLVCGEQVVEDIVQRSFPLARSSRTGAGVRSALTARLVDAFLRVQQSHGTAVAGILARELDGLGDLFHGQVPHGAETTPTAGAALHTLLARVTDEVPALTLVDGR